MLMLIFHKYPPPGLNRCKAYHNYYFQFHSFLFDIHCAKKAPLQQQLEQDDSESTRSIATIWWNMNVSFRCSESGDGSDTGHGQSLSLVPFSRDSEREGVNCLWWGRKLTIKFLIKSYCLEEVKGGHCCARTPGLYKTSMRGWRVVNPQKTWGLLWLSQWLVGFGVTGLNTELQPAPIQSLQKK